MKFPNGHIFIDSPSIRLQNSTWHVCRDFINFETRLHVEIATSIRPGNFNVDLTFKIDEISKSFARTIFCVVSMSNQAKCFTRCFLSIIFEFFFLREPILS